MRLMEVLVDSVLLYGVEVCGCQEWKGNRLCWIKELVHLNTNFSLLGLFPWSQKRFAGGKGADWVNIFHPRVTKPVLHQNLFFLKQYPTCVHMYMLN